jgi:hypothetical protein
MQTGMANANAFVIAAYVLTWVVLATYGHYVHRRFVRAERELGAESKETTR